MSGDVSVRRPKIGLALGSGAARGWAHIGVLKALERIGIKPDIIAGTSIGALVGGMAAAGHLDALEVWARALNRRKIVSFLDLRITSGGLIGGGRLAAEMRGTLGARCIEDLGVPYAAVCADLATGHEVWLRSGDMVDSIAASFALPGVFPPSLVEGRWLVDGALVNPVPVTVCRAMGASVVIAVNLNTDVIGKARRPQDGLPVAAGFDLLRYLDEMREAPPAASHLNALVRRIFRRDYVGPSLFGVMVSSLCIIQDKIARARLAGDPPDIHITPRVGHIGMLEMDRAAEAISEGEAAVERAIGDLVDVFATYIVPFGALGSGLGSSAFPQGGPKTV